jgi:predicted TIM-barrel fold metal-dependent hydrolase
VKFDLRTATAPRRHGIALQRIYRHYRVMSRETDAAIDCHAHIFTHATALNDDAWIKPKSQASIDQYRCELKKFGIRRAVLAASSLHAGGNAYAMSVTRADQDIRTTIIVTPDITLDRLREYDRSGVCGIRLQLRNKNIPDLRSAAYQRLFRRLAGLGWHVQLHDDSHRLPPVIDTIEAAGAPLVIDHFGRPGPAGTRDAGFRAVLEAVGRGRTWVKISAAFRLPTPELDRSLADALLDVRGPDRILWGSDWPFIGFEERMEYEQAVSHFVRAVPNAATRAAIHDTARRLYFGKPSPGDE